MSIKNLKFEAKKLEADIKNGVYDGERIHLVVAINNLAEEVRYQYKKDNAFREQLFLVELTETVNKLLKIIV